MFAASGRSVITTETGLPSIVRKSIAAALALLLLATLAVARIADLWWWHAQVLTTAEARAANLSHILAEYVGETFAAGDSALRQLVIHGRHIGGAAAPPGDWDPTLVAAKATLTGVGSISVVDRDGVIRHSTQKLIVGLSRRDDPIFRQLRDASSDELAIDTPFLSIREPRQYLIPIGRRLTDIQGRFDGAIVTTFIPAVPRGFFRTVDVGQRGVVWVFHPAGVLMFRERSGVNPMGQAAAANAIFAGTTGGRAAGTLRGAVEPGGPFLLSAFTTIPTPPLIVAISLDRGEVLEPWRREAVDSSAVMGVLALMVVAALAAIASAFAREQRARRDAESASALKDQFLMTVSHELRTPLTAIYGWARMLVAGTMNEHQRGSALQTIERNARAQMHIIDDLLDVSRVMGGKLRLDIQPVDVGEIVREAVETVRPAAHAKGIRIDVRVDPAASLVDADPERLQQIVWNLLSNAVKFTPADGRVTASVHAVASGVEVAVPTPARASPRSSCRTSSIASASRTRGRSAATGGSASVSRSSRAWSRCTAAPAPPPAPAKEKGRRFGCACPRGSAPRQRLQWRRPRRGTISGSRPSRRASTICGC